MKHCKQMIRYRIFSYSTHIAGLLWMCRGNPVCCLLSLLHLFSSLLSPLSLTTKSNLSCYPPPFPCSSSSQDHSLIKTRLPEQHSAGAEPGAGGCRRSVHADDATSTVPLSYFITFYTTFRVNT